MILDGTWSESTLWEVSDSLGAGVESAMLDEIVMAILFIREGSASVA
jgi:hypothetical protein